MKDRTICTTSAVHPGPYDRTVTDPVRQDGPFLRPLLRLRRPLRRPPPVGAGPARPAAGPLRRRRGRGRGRPRQRDGAVVALGHVVGGRSSASSRTTTSARWRSGTARRASSTGPASEAPRASTPPASTSCWRCRRCTGWSRVPRWPRRPGSCARAACSPPSTPTGRPSPDWARPRRRGCGSTPTSTCYEARLATRRQRCGAAPPDR